ncbi:MAG: ribbon-helix-helix protein, CopG family [Nitrosomonadales bacterium]|nr:ribbon-helix-helix protein, CopG family [Nitrosomonadales bacterium]
MKSTTLTLRIPFELMEQLDQMAATTQRTRSTLGCEAIRRFLDLEAAQTANLRPNCAVASAGFAPTAKRQTD